MPHNYGHVNVLAVSIALKFPFVLYVFYKLEGVKKYIFLILPIISIASVFLIGARTAALTIAIQLVFFSLFYFIYNKFSVRKSFLNIVILVIVAIAGTYLSTLPNNIYKKKGNTTKEMFFTKGKDFVYKDENEKIKLTNTTGRDRLWISALKDFKRNPWLGVGIGNWKFTSKEELLKISKGDGVAFYKRVHNDYLKYLAETGLFGFLFYLAYIIIIVFFALKLFKNSANENKMIYATLIIALIAYVIDAFFNFPHDRPPVQLLFAVLIALVLAYYHNCNAESGLKGAETKTIKNGSYVAIVLSVGLIVISFMDYSASVTQFKLIQQIQSKNAFNDGFTIKYNEALNEIKSFPEFNQVGMSNDDVLAIFAIKEKKYDLAINHLNASIKRLPNRFYPKYLLVTVYDSKQNVDSTLLYSKLVFDVFPAYDMNFTILKKIYEYKKDTTAIFQAFKKHLEVKNDNYLCWMNYAEAIRKYKRDDNLVLKKTDSLLMLNPNNNILLTYKKQLQEVMLDKAKKQPVKLDFDTEQLRKRSHFYNLGNTLFDESKFEASKEAYLKVLEIDSTNIASKYKLGLVEVKLKNYTKAIFYLEKVVNSNLIHDGKPEYNIGFSYFKLDDIEKAKSNFTKSYKKGFPLAVKIDPIMLNL
ncbi:O-antigen ligase family protein [Lacinutrix jangbogonensis]|uniref:O-antigen ligase family protein n=1 Tax=Lacinutrix jangbogonensis TaxID=1469557 RepID=UPI00138E4788|nr:O-antigen ligase family protein [Lacinutrix jangbogonensis]